MSAIQCPRCRNTGLKIEATEVEVSPASWFQRLRGKARMKLTPSGVACLCFKCGYAFVASVNGRYNSFFAKNPTPDPDNAKKVDLERNSAPRNPSRVPDDDLDLGQTP